VDDEERDAMSMLAQIQSGSDILNAVVAGEFSLEEAKQTFREIL
jgi:hypothetical protein